MEVSFSLTNLLFSSTRVDSQLPSICEASHGGWGSTEPHGPSSVQVSASSLKKKKKWNNGIISQVIVFLTENVPS